MDKNAFLIELAASDRTHFAKVAFAEQPEEQQVFSAIWELEDQVNNGGFASYFTCAGEGHHVAVAALRRIGADRCADIVARALRTASSQPLPVEQASRQQLVDGLDAQAHATLDALDREFFTYPDNLTDLLFEFVRRHPQVFGAIPPA